MENVLFDFIAKYVELSDEEKQAISALDIFREIKKGQILLQRGQSTINAYFVLQGCLRVYYELDGEEKTTAFYTEMEGLTPHTVSSGRPSEYFVQATEDSIISISDPSMEEEIFKKFPKFEKLCRILSEELAQKGKLDLDAFKISTPEQRYQSLLNNRPNLVQRVPQYQLASYLGIKPQSLSRIRARIADKNQ